MPAFGNNTVWAIRDNIRTLYTRRKKIGQLALTHEEYILTFVPSEARQLFRDISLYVDSQSHSHRFTLTNLAKPTEATLYIRDTKEKRQPPIGRTLELQPDAPKDVLDRIAYWAANGGDPSCEFGRVAKVFDLLNSKCSKKTMRYYWPTILSIMSEREDTKIMAKDLQDLRMPAKPEPLPRELLEACKLTAETIAGAKLIPATIKEAEPGEVMIEIKVGQTYIEPFAHFYGMT
jgi:hypothetical protein